MDRRARIELAELAARNMAESGLDWQSARTKAARRLGVTDSQAKRVEETDIRQALSAYQQLFEPDSAETLRRLREAALQVMHKLEPFQPRLHGAVAAGIVTDHTPIEVTTCVDSEKELETYLLNAGIDFDVVAAACGEYVRYRCDGADPVIVITANIRRPSGTRRRPADEVAPLSVRELEALLSSDSLPT